MRPDIPEHWRLCLRLAWQASERWREQTQPLHDARAEWVEQLLREFYRGAAEPENIAANERQRLLDETDRLARGARQVWDEANALLWQLLELKHRPGTAEPTAGEVTEALEQLARFGHSLDAWWLDATRHACRALSEDAFRDHESWRAGGCARVTLARLDQLVRSSRDSLVELRLGLQRACTCLEQGASGAPSCPTCGR